MGILARIKTWISGDTLTAADLNAEFNNVLNDYNGGITNVNISGSANISTAKINATFPSSTIVGINDSQTLTNKTLTTPVITNENRTHDFRAKAYLNIFQSIPTLTNTKIQLGAENYDPNNNFDVSSYRYTAPHNGIYLINGLITYDTTEDGKTGYAMIYLNGSVVAYGNQGVSGGTTGITSSATTMYALSAGDYVELYTLHNSSSPKQVNGGVATTYLEIFELART